ncbi:MAG: TIGR00153 family protein [Pseudomonadota bacterium]
MVASIFGSSPVRPLENHAGVVYSCAKKLTDLFAGVMQRDWQTVAIVHEAIVTLEQDADDLKKQIRLHLPRSLFMPVPREDLLELLLVQDRIANRAKDVADLVTSRKMEFPEQISDQFLMFVKRNVDAAKKARNSVRELDELYTTGFRGAEVDLVSSLIEKLDVIETESDLLEGELRASLFSVEKSLEPVDVIFLYRAIELTGQIGAMSERVGRRLELLLSH